MKNKLIILFPFLFSILIVSCRDKISNHPINTPDPTQPTQSGKNIIVFKLNGVYHICEGRSDVLDATGVDFGFVTNGNGLFLSANDVDYNLHLFIRAISITTDSIYNAKMNYPFGSYYLADKKQTQYLADTISSSLVFTRVDSNVLAGRFEFFGKKDSVSNIHLTDGWFDISR